MFDRGDDQYCTVFPEVPLSWQTTTSRKFDGHRNTFCYRNHGSFYNPYVRHRPVKSGHFAHLRRYETSGFPGSQLTLVKLRRM